MASSALFWEACRFALVQYHGCIFTTNSTHPDLRRFECTADAHCECRPWQIDCGPSRARGPLDPFLLNRTVAAFMAFEDPFIVLSSATTHCRNQHVRGLRIGQKLVKIRVHYPALSMLLGRPVLLNHIESTVMSRRLASSVRFSMSHVRILHR